MKHGVMIGETARAVYGVLPPHQREALITGIFTYDATGALPPMDWMPRETLELIVAELERLAKRGARAVKSVVTKTSMSTHDRAVKAAAARWGKRDANAYANAYAMDAKHANSIASKEASSALVSSDYAYANYAMDARIEENSISSSSTATHYVRTSTSTACIEGHIPSTKPSSPSKSSTPLNGEVDQSNSTPFGRTGQEEHGEEEHGEVEALRYCPQHAVDDMEKDSTRGAASPKTPDEHEESVQDTEQVCSKPMITHYCDAGDPSTASTPPLPRAPQPSAGVFGGVSAMLTRGIDAYVAQMESGASRTDLMKMSVQDAWRAIGNDELDPVQLMLSLLGPDATVQNRDNLVKIYRTIGNVWFRKAMSQEYKHLKTGGYSWAKRVGVAIMSDLWELYRQLRAGEAQPYLKNIKSTRNRSGAPALASVA